MCLFLVPKEGENVLWKREDGGALITVFFVLIIISILVIALSNSSFFDARFALRDEHSVQAHYLALAGVNLTADLIQKKPQLFLERTEPYYLYGSIDDGFIITDSKPADDIAPIRVKVTISDGGSSAASTIEIYSQATVGETVSVSKDIELVLSNKPNSSLPPIDLSMNRNYESAIDGGPSGLGWYKESGKKGKLENNKEMDESRAVKMGDGVSYSITDDNNSGHKLRAPGIYFTNKPESFRVEENVGKLEIETNYLYFAGDLVIENKGKKIILTTYIGDGFEDQPISGSDLRTAGYEDAVTDKSYGLIYLSNGLFEGKKNTSSKIELLPPGYYYFPSGINLWDLTWKGDITALIEAKPYQEIERTYK